MSNDICSLLKISLTRRNVVKFLDYENLGHEETTTNSIKLFQNKWEINETQGTLVVGKNLTNHWLTVFQSNVQCLTKNLFQWWLILHKAFENPESKLNLLVDMLQLLQALLISSTK